MKLAAIVCEYNPFHSGHRFQIEETRCRLGDGGAVVAVMSGNFVQRGDAAIYDKRIRAEAAVRCGADLVVELPAVCAMQPAEIFARNAVHIISSVKGVECLSFGAETPDKDMIERVAVLLAEEPPEFGAALRAGLECGKSYASARADAVCGCLGREAADFLSRPNNILAVEYKKALLKSNACIDLMPIPRRGANHGATVPDSGFASAGFIRDKIVSDGFSSVAEYMPDACRELFENEKIHSSKNAEKAIIAELIRIPASELRNISDVSEGLENRIKKAVMSGNCSLEGLLDTVKTKRYSYSRLRRVALSALLGITNADKEILPPYIKVLAHNDTGKKIIAAQRGAAEIPIVRNTSQVNKLKSTVIKNFYERERMLDKLYEAVFC